MGVTDLRLAYLYYYANLGGVTSVIKSRLPLLRRLGWRVDAYFDRESGGLAELLAHGVDRARVVGSIVGTLVGAFVMTIVDNGCTKLGLDNWVQEVATGAIIVGAVALDRLRSRG